jgi:hypothetical protein
MNMSLSLKCIKHIIPLIFICVLRVNAQDFSLSKETKSFDSFEVFGSLPKNWIIVGEVSAARNIRDFISTAPGTGTLVNQPKGKIGEHLVSAFDHGDIELELEFMVPKGSNSGIYLQGRYEVQIFDSWAVHGNKHSDAGGIYQRWDDINKKGYEGRPARVNVSKAPGLWQHFKIIFEAPRFNAEGEKIKNARFVEVFHNGVLIHENVEVTGPTRSSLFEDERAMGPIMIQGDHGPVAIRNISYKKFENSPPRLTDIKYSFHEGKFEKAEDLANLKPVIAIPLDKITWDLGHGQDDFAYAFSGNMDVLEPGDYTFSLVALGKSNLSINGNAVFEDSDTHSRSQTISLDKGIFPFRLVYYKNNIPRRMPELGWFVEGPGIKKSPLHALDSYIGPQPIHPIDVQPTSEPLILRGFFKYKEKKKTHTVSVGDPGKLNYAIDLQQGALLSIWRGDFVDAAPMWHQRGESQLMIPKGALIELSDGPTLAILKDFESPWPDSLGKDQLRIKGYDLDSAGRPTFNYTFENISITDNIVPEDGNKSLSRKIAYSNPGQITGVWVRITEAKYIHRLQDGSYSINKGQIYISLAEPIRSEALIRNSSTGQELLVPVPTRQEKGEIKYSLIW